MVGGPTDNKIYLEGSVGYGFDISESLSASFGATLAYKPVNEKDTADDKGFSNYTLSTGLAYAVTEAVEAGASVKYIGEIDDEAQPVNKEFVGMLGMSYSF